MVNQALNIKWVDPLAIHEEVWVLKETLRIYKIATYYDMDFGEAGKTSKFQHLILLFNYAKGKVDKDTTLGLGQQWPQ